ncbi:SAF domain-containing protein [Phytohabitans rumicis]|uniref:SAF domain-containing protein n=1 Tax=Phytohabitans rumicis TaxID=1076125 RepID=UPI001FE769F1|nr:SAF domain-containing protein [Phytohabitans rumicis]
MSSTQTLTTPSGGSAGYPAGLAAGSPGLRRRVSPVRVLLAVALILGFGLAGAVVAGQLDARQPVLVAARPVSAGQVIADADITVVRVGADSGVATIAGSARARVVGSRAVLPLAAGTLLSPAHVGAPAWPPPGQAVTAALVKAGRMPSGVIAGSRVTVLALPAANPASGVTSGQVVRAEATVVSVQPVGDLASDVAVSLLLAEGDATRVASAAGEVTLVQLGAGQ